MAKPNWKDKTIWTADNLPVMRGMNSESVDLIYLDPPFNSKRNYAAPIGSKAAGAEFKDTWTLDDVDVEWIDLIGQKHPALRRVLLAAMTNSDKSYLAYMAVRILEMQRILKPTGSIYLHCDPTMSHYLKLVMDAVFGKRNFRNEIVWCYSGGGVPRKDFPRKHDVILRYGKSERVVFNAERKPYKENTQAVGKHSTLSGGADIDLERGTPVTDWWSDIKTVTGWSPENEFYPTQKPLALLERIIKASSSNSSPPPPPRLFSTPFVGVRRRWWRQTAYSDNGLAWMYRKKRPSWWSGASKRNRGYSSLSFPARTYRRERTWDACYRTIIPQTKTSCTANRADIAKVASITSKNRNWKSTISLRGARAERITPTICNCYAPHATKRKATVAWRT